MKTDNEKAEEALVIVFSLIVGMTMASALAGIILTLLF